MTELDDLIREFLIESHEGLDRLERDLVDLETDPGNRAKLASVFRAIHTIKGACGFLGFPTLERVSHAGESLLSGLRDGRVVLDASVVTALLGMVDAIRRILTCIERSRGVDEGAPDHAAVIDRLQALAPDARDGQPIATPGAAPPKTAAAESMARNRRPGVPDRSLRIDAGLADTLMDLVGELVLARNQIVRLTATSADASLLEAAGRLNLVTSQLRESVIKTRMLPVGDVWSPFPRLVRDLATSCGKQVRMEMEGSTTSLDRGIVEAIKDPLTHIIRNAVDHGIETPAARLACGKQPEGTIRLHAHGDAGQVTIEVSDDGAGVAIDKVRARAVRCGVISGEQAQRMSEHDVARLIFLPGLSTADTVTLVSGRGVGMDVVKTHVERSGGTVEMCSVAGVGTTLRIRIPQTLAIVPALLGASCGERF